MLLGRPGNDFLDNPRFEPILAKLDKLRVPVYIHPGYPLLRSSSLTNPFKRAYIRRTMEKARRWAER